MKKIGIKLADGSFYPVLEEGSPSERLLDLTTAHNNQTKVMVDLYRSELSSMEDAEYVDSLQIENLIEHPNGEPTLSFTVSIDENNRLSAKMVDNETGLQSNASITLVSRTLEERLQPDEYEIKDPTLDGVTLTSTEENSFFDEPALEKDEEGTEEFTVEDTISDDDSTVSADFETIDSFDVSDNIVEEDEIPVEESSVELPEEDSIAEATDEPALELPEESTAETIEEADAENIDAAAETEPFAAEIPETEEFENMDTMNTEEPQLAAETELEPLPDFNEVEGLEPVDLNEEAENAENLDSIVNTLVAEPDLESLEEPTVDEDFDFETEPSSIRFNDEFPGDETGTFAEEPTFEMSASELPAVDDTVEAPADEEIIEPTFEMSTSELSEPEMPAFDSETDVFEQEQDADALAETLSGTPDFENSFEEFGPTAEIEEIAPVEEESETFEDIPSIAEPETASQIEETAVETSDLPDMDFDLPDVSEVQSADANSQNTDLNLESDSLLSDTITEPDLSFDNSENSMQDFASDTIEDDEPFTMEETQETAVEEANSSDYDLPDFDSFASNSENSGDLDLPDFTQTTGLDNYEVSDEAQPDSTLPDLDDLNFDSMSASSETDTSLDDFDLPDFEDTASSEAPAKGLSFTGLYDKETELGDSTAYGKESGNSKGAVIICILCAIICVLATLFVLAVIPSKFNLFGKKTADAEQPAAIEQPSEPAALPVQVPAAVEPEPQPEFIPQPEPEQTKPAVPEAKEEEVIIIEKAEEVVPSAPPVTPVKLKDINYKIKWGDTLWDISDTFYKNPWRYKYIARYNGIKNPDYIVSGTYISIPAE